MDQMTKLFKQILLPVDFSQCSDEAFRIGCRLARMVGATVVVLHVVDTSILTTVQSLRLVPVLSDTTAQIKRLRHYARSNLRRLLESHEAKGVNCTRLILEGTPFEEIGKVARTQPIDLIVMGTYGGRAANVPKLFFGSTAERVVRTAVCPVLTIPLSGPLNAISPEKGKRQ
jgi:nucleotide-binding universal stress UspA family protein